MLKILIVDDRLNFREAVEDTLKLRMGYEVDLDIRVPEKRGVPFGCELPSPRELESYDLALIDLELFPPESSVEYQENDLRGGSEVLPYLRKHAPWLPVLAVSRLFADRSDSFLALAGGFGFDAYLPQGLFGPRAMLRDQWEAILKRSRGLRRRALVGDTAYVSHGTPGLEIDPNLKKKLDDNIPDWDSALRSLFFFADSIVLEEMTPGLSGAALVKAYVRGPDTDASFEGEWAAKISKSPGKLHEEAAAHLRLLRNGFPFTRMVPLLWPGVLVEDRVGVIAYKFAAGAQTAAQQLESGLGLEMISKRVAAVLGVLYKSAGPVKGIVGEVLRHWVNPKRLEDGLKILPDSKRKVTLTALLKSTTDSGVSKALTYRKGYIHGDLHCANIMFGPTDVLIDFAFSAPGPLAADAARFLVDLALRCAELRTTTPVTWDSLPLVMAPVQQVFDFRDDDKELFALAFDAFAVEALTYPPVSAPIREWIEQLIAGRV